MPYGTCQGDYTCDSCGRDLLYGSSAWVDLPRRKIYCKSCKSGKEPQLVPVRKKFLVLKMLLKILRRKNRQLKQMFEKG